MQTSKKGEHAAEVPDSAGCDINRETAQGLDDKDRHLAGIDNNLQEVKSVQNVASGDAIDIFLEGEHTGDLCASKDNIPVEHEQEIEPVAPEKAHKSNSQETSRDTFSDLEYTSCVSRQPVEDTVMTQGTGINATTVLPAEARGEDDASKHEKYRFPDFPDVPSLQSTLAELAAQNEAEEWDLRAIAPERSNSTPLRKAEACDKHACCLPDDYDQQYQRVFSARLQQPSKLLESRLCGSCSRSMMGYVYAIQNLLQSLAIDIITKGNDPPACSWCARDRFNQAFQDKCHSDTEFSSVLSPFLDSELPASDACSVLEHGTSPQGVHDTHCVSYGGRSPDKSPSKSPWGVRRPARVFGNPDRDILDGQRPQSSIANYQMSASPSVHPSHVQWLEKAQPVERHGQKQGLPSVLMLGQKMIVPLERDSQKQNETSSQTSPCNMVTFGDEQIVPKPGAFIAGQHASTGNGPIVQDSSAMICDVNGNRHMEQVFVQSSPGAVESSPDSDSHEFAGGKPMNWATQPTYKHHSNSDEEKSYDYEKGTSSTQDIVVKQPVHHSYPPKRRLSGADQMLGLVQEHLLEPSQPAVKNQAYVTMAGNDLTAMLCLVLGNSLLVSGTTRTLVVLVTDGVSPALRHLLSSVFNVVQSVRSLGTQGTTKLTLLEQPDIGVSFTKLHAWRLTQFSKCVFLDAATMMVQCCDELFERDELSAVPDIGWPDCFNSGVFVYVPCMETFWDLVSFAERQGSFDGGDQGLLNMYFRNWSSDINRRLPFIYNLMANVSYTYKPAFKQFGRNVKIVQFFGGYKPWNVKFHAPTGQMSPAAGVHPSFAQFVQFWLHIFVRRVLPMLSKSLQDKAQDSQYICALDLLHHFPSFLTEEPVVTLPTPSFRSHPKPIIYLPPSPRMPPDTVEKGPALPGEVSTEPANSTFVSHELQLSNVQSVPTDATTEVAEEVVMKEMPTEQAAHVKPSGFVEDFSGMLAWEQGRADYMGEHKSDNIIARLDQLIKSPSTERCVAMKD